MEIYDLLYARQIEKISMQISSCLNGNSAILIIGKWLTIEGICWTTIELIQRDEKMKTRCSLLHCFFPFPYRLWKIQMFFLQKQWLDLCQIKTRSYLKMILTFANLYTERLFMGLFLSIHKRILVIWRVWIQFKTIRINVS